MLQKPNVSIITMLAIGVVKDIPLMLRLFINRVVTSLRL